MDFVNIVETLIEFGSDPNIRDFDESTPLHCAAEQGSLKSVEFFLQKTNCAEKH